MAAYAGVAVVYNDRLIIQVYSTDEKKKTKRIKTIALAAQVGVSNISTSQTKFRHVGLEMKNRTKL